MLIFVILADFYLAGYIVYVYVYEVYIYLSRHVYAFTHVSVYECLYRFMYVHMRM